MKKVYGQSRDDTCPWCGKKATVQNDEGLLVCQVHKNDKMPSIRCTCGDWLDLKAGKFGPYFNCFNCGNISFGKGMELKELNIPGKNRKKSKTEDKPEEPKPTHVNLDTNGKYVEGEFIISIDDL